MLALTRVLTPTTTTTARAAAAAARAGALRGLVVAVSGRFDPHQVQQHKHLLRSSSSSNSSSGPSARTAIGRTLRPLPTTTTTTTPTLRAANNAANAMATTTTTPAPADPKKNDNDDPAIPPLDAKDDAYGGVIVDDARLPQDPAEFDVRLAASLVHWRARAVRGVWLRLPPALASHVAPAVSRHGFGFHHAEPGYVMLTRWLPLDQGVESGLPPNASHQVGVGALVVDARRGLVLAVQERTGPLRGKNVWKLPTGLVHAGEDLHTAAEREVEEETGVRARFAGVLAVRQAHGFAFGKSDLFFLCALVADDDDEGGGGGGGGGGTGEAKKAKEAKEGDQQQPQPHNHPAFGPPQRVVPCEREIERAAWLTADEYEREQSKFNGHLPLYSRLLGRSMRFSRAAAAEFAARAAATGGGSNDEERPAAGGAPLSSSSSAAAALSAAVEVASRMGMRGQVLDGGIWKPRSDLLLWAGEEEEEAELLAGPGAGAAATAADAGGGAKL